MNNTELHNVLAEMIEHTSVMTIFEEMVTSMSTDELEENVKHLDQYLFANHFLTREDWRFDRILKQKKMGKLTKFEKAIISAGLELVKLQQQEENERIRAKGNNPIFGDNYIPSIVENITHTLKLRD